MARSRTPRPYEFLRLIPEPHNRWSGPEREFMGSLAWTRGPPPQRPSLPSASSLPRPALRLPTREIWFHCARITDARSGAMRPNKRL